MKRENPLLITGLVLFGLAAICILNKSPIKTIFRANNPYHETPESITVYNPKDTRIVYIDKQPFGSLDSIIDYTSGQKIERNPDVGEYTKFDGLKHAPNSTNLYIWADNFPL